jgi:hypothetical protein
MPTERAFKPQIVLLRSNIAGAVWHNVCFLIWRDKPTLDAVEEVGRHYRALATAHPKGFVVLVIIEATTPLPDEPVRRAITRHVDEIGQKMRAIASVHEATGFFGAAVRSILTAMKMVAREKVPTQMAGSLEDAAVWLAPFTQDSAGRMTPSRELAAAFNEFRAAVRAAKG